MTLYRTEYDDDELLWWNVEKPRGGFGRGGRCTKPLLTKKALQRQQLLGETLID